MNELKITLPPEKALVLAGTGHRPEKLGGYSPEVFQRLVEYTKEVIRFCQPMSIISGMAIGFDMALAQASVDLGIPLVAAVPFKGQESRWRPEQKDLYHTLLSKAEHVEIVCNGGYSGWKFIQRDRWMVDHAEAMIALWNGECNGGTWQTIKYAESVERPVYNIWSGWKFLNDEKNLT